MLKIEVAIQSCLSRDNEKALPRHSINLLERDYRKEAEDTERYEKVLNKGFHGRVAFNFRDGRQILEGANLKVLH